MIHNIKNGSPINFFSIRLHCVAFTLCFSLLLHKNQLIIKNLFYLLSFSFYKYCVNKKIQINREGAAAAMANTEYSDDVG